MRSQFNIWCVIFVLFSIKYGNSNFWISEYPPIYILEYHNWVVLLLKKNRFIITVSSIHFREKNSVCVSHRVFQDVSILSELQQDVRRWSWRKTNKHTNIHVLPILTIRIKLLAKLLLPKYSDPGLVQLIIRWQRFTLTIERIHLSWRKAHLMHTCRQRQVEQASSWT